MPYREIDAVHVRDCIPSAQLYLGNFGYIISVDAKVWDGKKQTTHPSESLFFSIDPLAPKTCLTKTHEKRLVPLGPLIAPKFGEGYAKMLGREMANKARKR